ncbi:hypothetical protein HPB47_001772, partial [Ixodes persulcatus]
MRSAGLVAVLLLSLALSPITCREIDPELRAFVSTLERYSTTKNDIIFLLESGNIDADHFPDALVFTETLARMFIVSPEYSRLTVMTSSDENLVHIDQVRNIDDANMCTFVHDVNRIQRRSGNTKTREALEHAKTILRNARHGVNSPSCDLHSPAHVLDEHWDKATSPNACERECDANAICACGARSGSYQCVCNYGYTGEGSPGQCQRELQFGVGRLQHRSSAIVFSVFKEMVAGVGLLAAKPGSRDKKAPVIRCPGNITRSVDAGQSHATITWSQPKARDNSGVPPRIQQEPENIVSPWRFPIGQTVIRFRATDAARLWAECTFTVTVMSNQCDEPPVPENGYVIGCDGDRAVGTTCTYRCNLGHRLFGKSTTVCTANKTWTETGVACNPYAAGLGEFRLSRTYVYNDWIQPRCLRGFEHRGPLVILCGANGQWSGPDNQSALFSCVVDERRELIRSRPRDRVTTCLRHAINMATGCWRGELNEVELQMGDYSEPLGLVPYAGTLDPREVLRALRVRNAIRRSGSSGSIALRSLSSAGSIATGSRSSLESIADVNVNEVYESGEERKSARNNANGLLPLWKSRSESLSVFPLERKMNLGDTEKPQIECPQDEVRPAEARQSYARIAWRQPEVKDNSGEIPFIQKWPQYITSPWSFPIGRTVIRYRATDAAFLSAQCTFTVTVLVVCKLGHRVAALEADLIYLGFCIRRRFVDQENFKFMSSQRGHWNCKEKVLKAYRNSLTRELKELLQL